MRAVSSTRSPLGLRAPARVQPHYGLSLLQVLLLVAVLSSLAVMAYLSWQQRTLVNTARQEQHGLAQADRALVTFTTVMRRLPCPDTDRDGLENCESPLQKGWLPVRSLKLAGADAGVGIGQLRYLVQRGGAGDDLTLLTDTWRPLSYDEDVGSFFAMREASGYQDGILTLPDFCQRLSVGAAADYAPGRAAVRSMPARNVAYALVHPGMQGNTAQGSLFDGANETALNEVEDASHAPVLATYDDVVMARSYDSVYQQLGCQALIDSINLIALAEDVSADVEDKRQGSIVDAQKAIAFASIGAAITAVETASTVIEGISDAKDAGIEWALCAATLGLAFNACAAAPQHTAAIILTGGVVAANIASIAANIVAAVKAGEALALADNSIDASDLSCPNVVGPEEAIAMLEAEVTAAQQALQALEDAIDDKEAELVTAQTARNQAINALRNAVRFNTTASSIDALVDQLIAAANGQSTAQANFDRLAAEIDLLQDTVGNYSANLAEYNQILSSFTGAANAGALANEIASLQQQIAALEAQEDALEGDPVANEAALQAVRQQMYRLIARRNLLVGYRDTGDLSELQAEIDRANDELGQAQTRLNTALQSYASSQSSLNGALASYATAYSNLLNHGAYQYGPLLQQPACTSLTAGLCMNVLDTTASIYNAIAQLMGGNGSAGPQPGSRFLRPQEIQQELAALEQQRTPASERVTQAQTNLADARAAATDMPVCTISGTGVGPMPVEIVRALLINADRKGGTR